MKTSASVRDRLRFADVRGMYLSDEERCELDGEMDQILEAIVQCPTLESAESMLNELDLFQGLLQQLNLKYQVELSEKQDRLAHQYDNWGKPHIRRANFEAIKRGQFP